MKRVLSLFLLLAKPVLAQSSIEDFQWENRLLVISIGDPELVRQIERERSDLEDRDLRVFVLGGDGKSEHPANKGLSGEFGKRLRIEAGKPRVFLIGKDGRTTLSWQRKNFTFRKLYARIDAMPMRRQEMKKRNR